MEHHRNRTLSVLGLSGYLFVVLAGSASVWAQSSAGSESALVRLSGSFERLSEQAGPGSAGQIAPGYSQRGVPSQTQRENGGRPDCGNGPGDGSGRPENP
jgi:hypothetical protein